MTGSPPPRARLRRDRLLIALIVASALAGLFVASTIVIYSEWSRVSPCNGGPGLSHGCPAYVQFQVEQVGNGTLANGTYTYSFLLYPLDSTSISTTALTIALHSGNGTNASPGTVGLYSLSGALLVSYHSSNSGWQATQSMLADLPAFLRLTSSTPVTGDSVAIADSADGVTDYRVIS